MLEVNKKPSKLRATRRTSVAPIAPLYPEPEAPKTSAGFRINSEAASGQNQEIAGAPVFLNPAETKDYQSRPPVIMGEAHYRGTLPVDGMISGQISGSGGSLNVRQKFKGSCSTPDLSGEISFRDLVRVNGYVAGSIYSSKGTLVVDRNARVDARVEVAIALIGGTVNGDIIAHERVELGPDAKIYGNILTRSIAIKGGAMFEGVCHMMNNPDTAVISREISARSMEHL